MRVIKREKKGFTLVEIMLVLLITSVLVLGINAAFRKAHMLWSRAEEQRPVYQKTRLLFDTLREELSGLYMPKIDGEQPPAPFALSALPDGTVEMSFFTLNPAWNSTAFSDLPAKVTYEFTTGQDADQRILSRTEQLFSGQIAVGPVRKESILEGFSEIIIQALDSQDDSWKIDLQSQEKPPKAIKVLLKWAKDDQTEFEFPVMIRISCRGQIVPS